MMSPFGGRILSYNDCTAAAERPDILRKGRDHNEEKKSRNRWDTCLGREKSRSEKIVLYGENV